MDFGRCEECTKATMSHRAYARWNQMMMKAELAMACDGRMAPFPVKPEGELPVFCRKAHVKPRSKLDAGPALAPDFFLKSIKINQK